MRVPKISLRKCFLLTIGFAVLVIFGINIREKDFWKSNKEFPSTGPQALALQQQQTDNRHLVSTHNNNNGNQKDAVIAGISSSGNVKVIFKYPCCGTNFRYEHVPKRLEI